MKPFNTMAEFFNQKKQFLKKVFDLSFVSQKYYELDNVHRPIKERRVN